MRFDAGQLVVGTATWVALETRRRPRAPMSSWANGSHDLGYGNAYDSDHVAP
jgi:hypothetical protein